MKPALLIFSLLTSLSFAAQPDINVVYPRKDQRLPLVDSTFILGNVTPGSRLYINAIEIPVNRSGGWLGYIDVSPGSFTFDITAKQGGSESHFALPVIIGSTPDSTAAIPDFPSPNSKSLYFVDDVFEFSFRAPPGGRGWFQLDDGPSIEMYQGTYEQPEPGSVFGRITMPQLLDTASAIYIGQYRFAPTDTGIHRICYKYLDRRLMSVENPVVYKNCTDTILTILPQYPPLVGEFIGQSQIVRTAPRMGYKLLYQPAGVAAQIVGAREGFYKIKLSDFSSGYVNIDSVELLPPGTIIPRGQVSFITVDTLGGDICVSADIGTPLPYEIEETLDPPGITVTLYGAVASVDWIRHNTANPLIKLVKWSQPEDLVFRLEIELGKSGNGGYRAYYTGNRFNLCLSPKPIRVGMFSRPLKDLKVLIDPGHSRDPGALGPTGLQEADANLWIAHELRKMLERKGANVMMTRYGHEDVALYDRPALAEVWGADILVSIHNNSLPDGINPFYNNGTSVYYYHPHSKPLAEAIHKHMVKETRLKDHGLYYGNLVLTRTSVMPAVLVECAFMIIPDQEAKLKTDKFQRQCAGAILSGIEDYLKIDDITK